MSSLHETLVELFNDSQKLLHQQIRPIFRSKKFPLPPAAMMIVHSIAHEPGITVSELSRRTQIAKSHVSNILEDMSKRGLLEKRPDSEDQRLVRIYLADHAAEQMHKMHQEIRNRLTEVVSVLPDEKVVQIIEALKIFKEALSTHEHQGTSEASENSES